MSEAGNDYGAKDITVLEGLEAVRRRPGMYIGSTGARGLHHLVYEVVDNSVDEAMAGRCSRIEITLLDDGGVRVGDDGRGIPVGEHPRLGRSALEVVLTVLHAGGKFDSKSYAVSGGLHGVGVSVVNALSSRLVADVRRDGRHYRQSYRRGVPDGPVTDVGPAEETGTTITFWPDADVFEAVDYNWDTLTGRFRETAFLTAGLTIDVADERPVEETPGEARRAVFFYEGGLRDFVTHLNTAKEPLHDSIIHFSASGRGADGPHEVEVAVQWNSTYHESIHSFANTINTHEGGTHEEGFKKALTSVVNRFVRETGAHRGNGRSGRGELTLTGEDVREGLTAIVSVKMANPQFEGQTKTKLGNTEAKTFIQKIVNEHLTDWFDRNPNEAADIVRKAIQAATARVAARKARDLTRRKGLLESASLPGKLSDCQSNDPTKCEIF
ncbi:MAG: ATP-binding protein, partial [Actinomycetota bacterium]|nr:ATP-binding protein [Actinomycetota bacterium]